MYDKKDDVEEEISGITKGSKYNQTFKENVVRYRLDHPEFPPQKAVENLGNQCFRSQNVDSIGQRARRKRGNT